MEHSLERPDGEHGELRVWRDGHSSPGLVVCVCTDVARVDLPAFLHPARRFYVVYTCPLPLERRYGAFGRLPAVGEVANLRIWLAPARCGGRWPTYVGTLLVVCTDFRRTWLYVVIFDQLDEIGPSVRRNPCLKSRLAVV